MWVVVLGKVLGKVSGKVLAVPNKGSTTRATNQDESMR